MLPATAIHDDVIHHKQWPNSPEFDPLPTPYISSKIHGSPRPDSVSSDALEDVLLPGDVVGERCYLQSELVRRVTTGSTPRASLDDPSALPPASQFEVVRRLGTGSYAVVYLVREIISRSDSARSSIESGVLGSMELDGSSSRKSSTIYGREFAIKCLSKANLDDEQLAAQLSEVKIHQSLHSHPNIVTLHRTLETSSFLLLVLEYVPGEDLFYFLEQARDHYDTTATPPPTAIGSGNPDESFSSNMSNTPPTPSLLSTLHPSQLLSRTRLRLVASMFSQMCDAVAACHTQHVFHRDIKPENFIVTDGHTCRSDGSRERKVMVKLTDFGLSTTDEESGDMDCGSAPYMSYECRNNVSPTYRPDAADVWSLGIVLINMLYHHNPWADTMHGACASFDLFRSNPVHFFMTRFGGMTRPVAEHLANKVFCIRDDDPTPGGDRITASQFGSWARDLPDLLAMPLPDTLPFRRTHKRVVSTASSIDHPVSSTSQLSHRPCSRNPSGSGPVSRMSAIRSRSLSRAPSLGPARETSEACELSTVIDQDEFSGIMEEPQEIEMTNDGDMDDSVPNSRSTSQQRKRKRGTRKGKGSSSTAAPSPITPKDETLEVLAQASQSLAREISRQSKASSAPSTSSKTSSARRRAMEPYEPPEFFPVPTSMLGASPLAPPPLPHLSSVKSQPSLRAKANPPTTPTAPTKKPSKWKLSFGKSSGSSINTASISRTTSEDSSSSPLTPPSAFAIREVDEYSLNSSKMSATANNVSAVLMGLNPSQPAPKSAPSDGTWTRGRRNRGSPGPPGSATSHSQSRSRGRYTTSAFDIPPDAPVPPIPAHAQFMRNSNLSSSSFERGRSERGVSPNSTRSGGRLASSASSMASSNWRSSMSTTSSAFTSSSAFTRYSNGSSRSVSTAATSVSGHSGNWRKENGNAKMANSRYHPGIPGNVPRNIKIMNGIPGELVDLPRGQPGFNNTGDFNSAARKQRSRRPKDLQLDLAPITETGSRPSREKAEMGGMQDASTSTTDLGGDGKAHKGQINTLAKMLSALRR